MPRARQEREIAEKTERNNKLDVDLQLEMEDMRLDREQQIRDSLSKSDIIDLIDKWGDGYALIELAQLERTYQEYANEYEMSVDREQILKNICKTALKMDQALDSNDIKAYKDLSSVYDQLRKSGKFTDSQKKDLRERDIDSIGQLVQFVEDEGGIIPQAPDPMEEPQDKIDFMIRDMKLYVDNLVKNELGLGNLIESYLTEAKKNRPKNVDDVINGGLTQEEVTQQDAVDFNNFLMNQMTADNLYANAMNAVTVADGGDTNFIQTTDATS